MDFSKIQLLPDELKLLQSLAKHGPRALRPAEEEPAKSLQVKFHLIRLMENGQYEALKDGKRFLLWRADDRFRHRKPVYISRLALLISFASLVLSIASFFR